MLLLGGGWSATLIEIFVIRARGRDVSKNWLRQGEQQNICLRKRAQNIARSLDLILELFLCCDLTNRMYQVLEIGPQREFHTFILKDNIQNRTLK